MRKTLLMLALVVVFSALAANAAPVITFDDLSGSGVVQDGYAGVTWYGDWNYYDSYQPPYNPHSNYERVYDFVNDGKFTFGSKVVFDGAWFSGYSFATVQFELYNNGNLVWTSGMLAPSDTPTFLASGYSGLVDTVVVSSPSPDFFVMDDVTYNSNGSTPEPGTLVLMGTGLVGLAGAVRRRFAL